MLQTSPWILAMILAVLAGAMDWRFRRIPNWLTVGGFVVGLAANTALFGWQGLKTGLLGAALGLALLLPFVLIRSLGAGDFKLAGALGACIGPRQLVTVLMGTVLLAGVMAIVIVIVKGRFLQTLRNIAHMLGAFLTLRMPGGQVSLDDPRSTKIPFGVAMAASVLICGVLGATGRLAR